MQKDERLRGLLAELKVWGWESDRKIGDFMTFLRERGFSQTDAYPLREIARGYFSKAQAHRNRNKEKAAQEYVEEALRSAPFDWEIIKEGAHFLWESKTIVLDPAFQTLIWQRYLHLSPNRTVAKSQLQARKIQLPSLSSALLLLIKKILAMGLCHSNFHLCDLGGCLSDVGKARANPPP